MGKGTIISGGTDGQYQVQVIYNTDRVRAEKTANLAKIANLETQIAAETDEHKLNVLKLQKVSLEKRNSALDAIQETIDISAWCADLTEDLSGDVGLIEVPGESVAFNIQPGHEGNAAYDATRDGQLTPTMAMTPAAAFYNLAMLPGWQKWKPTFRYGTITSITGDTANVTLESAISTQQSLGVNQASSLTNVAIEYMTCNGGAFEVGDDVLVKFTGQNWAAPTIIGFKDNPQGCLRSMILINIYNRATEVGDMDGDTVDQYYLWDLELNEELPVLDGDGNVVTDPTESETDNYIDSLGVSGVSGSNFTQLQNTETEFIGNRYYTLGDDSNTILYCAFLNIPTSPYYYQSNIAAMDGSNYNNTFTSEHVGSRSAKWTAEIHNFHGYGRTISYDDGTKSCFTLHQTEDKNYEYLEIIPWPGFPDGVAVKSVSFINKTHEIHTPYGAIQIDDGVDYYSCKMTVSRDGPYDSDERDMEEGHDLTPRGSSIASKVGQNSFLNLFSMPVREYKFEIPGDYLTPVEVLIDRYKYTVVAGAEYFENPTTAPADMTRAEIISVGRNTDLEDFISGKLSAIDDTILLDLTCELYE